MGYLVECVWGLAEMLLGITSPLVEDRAQQTLRVQTPQMTRANTDGGRRSRRQCRTSTNAA